MWIGIRKAPDEPNLDEMRQQLKRLMQGSKATDMKERIQHMLDMGMDQEQAEDMAEKYEEHLEKPIQARMEELRQKNPEMDEGRLRRIAEADITTPGSPMRVAAPEQAPEGPEKIGEQEQRPSLGRGQTPAPRGEFLQPLREGEDERRKKTVQLGTESGFGGFNKETILHDPTGRHPLFYGSPRKLQDAQAKHQQASQMAERLQPQIDRLHNLSLQFSRGEKPDEKLLIELGQELQPYASDMKASLIRLRAPANRDGTFVELDGYDQNAVDEMIPELMKAGMNELEAETQARTMLANQRAQQAQLFELASKGQRDSENLGAVAQVLDEKRFALLNELQPHTQRIQQAKAEMEKHGPQSHMSLEKYLGRMLSGASAGARDMQFGGQGRKGGVGLADFQQKILGQDVADVGRGTGSQQEMIDRMFELHQSDPLNLSSNVLSHLQNEGLSIDLERSPSMANLDISAEMDDKKRGLEAMMQAAQKRDEALEQERKQLIGNPTPENIQRMIEIDQQRQQYDSDIRRMARELETGHMSVLTPEILAERVFGQGRDMSKDPTIVRPGEGGDAMDMRMENQLNILMSRLGLEEAPEGESDGERAMREQQIVSARKQFRDLIQQGASPSEARERVRQTVEESKTRFAGEAAPYGTLSVQQPSRISSKKPVTAEYLQTVAQQGGVETGQPASKVRQDFPHAPQGEDYTLDDSDAPPVETPDKPSWMDPQKQVMRDRRRFGNPFGSFGMQVPEKEDEEEDDDMKQTGFPMYIGDVLMKSVQNRLWWQGL